MGVPAAGYPAGRVVGRRLFASLLALVLLALILAGGAAADPQELLPGVTYDRQLSFLPTGPVVVNVLTAPKPGGLYALRPVLSNDAIPGTEQLTALLARLSPATTAVGIDGDLVRASGEPAGILMRSGGVDHPPAGNRSSIGIDSAGTLHVDRVSLFGTWQGSGPRRTLAGPNTVPGPNATVLYTPAWGPVTPVLPESVAVVLDSLPSAAPNQELSAKVTQVATDGGTPIPPGGAVLVARGNSAQYLQAEAPVGQTVKIRLILKPAWSGITDALGGGPLLVRNGTPVFRSNENFDADQLQARSPRAAVGQLADGRIVLVVVDGGAPGYSLGMTSFELALELVRLGAVTAASLASGAQAEMAFDGSLLSRPSGTGGEAPVGECLCVLYGGVYAAPPAVPVVSPNGDGVADTQQLAYKIVRPSNVTVSLIGPDGVSRLSSSGPVAPGTYPVGWAATRSDGTPEVEGLWRFVVTAVDDQGRQSTAERDFTLNDTLAAPRTLPPALAVPRAVPRAVAAFQLAHPATVTEQIETAAGALVATVATQAMQPGEVDVVWNGVAGSGAAVYSGRYVARVIAENELGRVDLTAPFTVRRVAPPPPERKAKSPPAPRPSARRGH